eukprot:GFYU01001057.1.p1 GENE.GFYU01001057.1~~GFYU01001057.1.p1  ORF type:complete len:502 (+),score=139.20 GFYU01001057.1:163-1668(+)
MGRSSRDNYDGSVSRLLKIDTMTSQSLWLIFIGYLVLWAGLVALGFFVGPNPTKITEFIEHENAHNMTEVNHGVPTVHHKFVGYINSTTTLSQHFYLYAKLQNKMYRSHGYKKDLAVSTQVFGRNANEDFHALTSSAKTHTRAVDCPDAEQWCDRLTIVHQTFIDYDAYKVIVEFEKPEFVGDVDYIFEAVDKNFTLYELIFRYVMLFFVMLAIFEFWLGNRRNLQASGLAERGVKGFNTEQSWIMFLLLAMVLFNNPIVACDLLLEGYFWPMLSTLMLIGFLAFMFMFWLVTLELILQTMPGYRAPDSLIGGIKLYYAKIFWATAFLCTCGIFFIWFRVLEREDPTMVYQDFRYFNHFITVAACLVLIWLFWFIHLLMRCWEMLGSDYAYTSRFKFVGSMSCFVLLMTLGGLGEGFIGPKFHNAASFTFFMALYNLYAFVMMYVHLPDSGKAPGAPQRSRSFDSRDGDRYRDDRYYDERDRDPRDVRMDDDEVSNDSFNF